MKKFILTGLISVGFNCYSMEINENQQPTLKENKHVSFADQTNTQIAKKEEIESSTLSTENFFGILKKSWKNPNLIGFTLKGKVIKNGSQILNAIAQIEGSQSQNLIGQNGQPKIDFGNLYLALLKNGGVEILDDESYKLIFAHIIEKKLPLSGLEQYSSENEIVIGKVLENFFKKLPEFDENMSQVDSTNLNKRYGIENKLNIHERNAASKLVQYMKTKNLPFFITNQEQQAALIPKVRQHVIEALKENEVRAIAKKHAQTTATFPEIRKLVITNLDNEQVAELDEEVVEKIARLDRIQDQGYHNFTIHFKNAMKELTQKIKESTSPEDSQNIVDSIEDDNVKETYMATKSPHDALAAKNAPWYHRLSHLGGAFVGYTLFLNFFGTHAKSALHHSFKYLYSSLKSRYSQSPVN